MMNEWLMPYPTWSYRALAQQQDVHEPSGRLKSTGFTHRYRPWSWRWRRLSPRCLRARHTPVHCNHTTDVERISELSGRAVNRPGMFMLPGSSYPALAFELVHEALRSAQAHASIDVGRGVRQGCRSAWHPRPPQIPGRPTSQELFIASASAPRGSTAPALDCQPFIPDTFVLYRMWLAPWSVSPSASSLYLCCLPGSGLLL